MIWPGLIIDSFAVGVAVYMVVEARKHPMDLRETRFTPGLYQIGRKE